MPKPKVKKVVLAYSGGLDTSVIVPWLRENYNCEVICFCADIGQGEELSGLEAKAKASGASKLIIKDLRDEFAREYLCSRYCVRARFTSASTCWARRSPGRSSPSIR